jgi:Sulfotransferase domain
VAPAIDLAPPRTAVRLPDFLIAGHPKCGTTALYEMLKGHPDVFLPETKEPWFFCEELHENLPPRPSGTPRTLAEYAAWFDGARDGQKVGEGSTYYLWSHTAAANIAKVLPDARIVAMLREPASFIRSLHLQLLEIYVEDELDLRRAIELEAARSRGEVPRGTYLPQLLQYSSYIDYAEQLRRYHELFDREQIKVLIYDDFRADNEATVREVRRFIGVDDSLPVQALDVNPTVAPRSQRLSELVETLGVGRGPVSTAVKEMIKAVTPAAPRRRAMYAFKERFVFGPPPEVDEELMRELRVRFASKVEEASEYLGRDLVALWGYDRL